MNRASVIGLPLIPPHSIIFDGNIISDLHPLYQECNLGAKQGLCVLPTEFTKTV